MPKDNYLIISRKSLGESRASTTQSDCANNQDCLLASSDCACADVGQFLQRTQEQNPGRELHAPPLHRQRLDGEQFVLFNPLADTGPVVVNQPVVELLEDLAASAVGVQPSEVPPQVLEHLLKANLIEPVSMRRRLTHSTDRTLSAWLHVTNACNLRCTYCYLTKTSATMSSEVGRKAVDAVIRAAVQHGYTGIKLKYAGGEATLNDTLVQELHRYAKEKCAARQLELAAVVLSNGVRIADNFLGFLAAERMDLMISLDGLGLEHDRQRPNIGGGPTSAQVRKTIDRALSAGVTPHLSITVTAQNAASLAETVVFVVGRGLPFNLNFYRSNELTRSRADLAAEDEAMIHGVRAAMQAVEDRMPRHSLLASLIDRANFAAPHEHTCGAGHDYLVVDHNGGIARCQMEIEDLVADIDTVDPLGEIRLHANGFQNLVVEEKDGCRTCDWRYWCTGGCPALTYAVTGRNDVKSPYCNVYQALFPDLLRLEGKRLVKEYSST